jgi:hypothetical protein
MANGDVQANLSDQYLQQFDRSIGVSGMQKLQEFPSLQQLGYAGQLSSLKNDFHGLQDFKQQLSMYSNTSTMLKIAWSVISSIVPNNANVARMLIKVPGLGTVGQAFQTVHNFGQVFALSPGDLAKPSTVNAKASVYKNQSTQTSNTTQNSATTQIGGGAGITGPGNASEINGITVIGIPQPGFMLQFDGVNLIWVTPPAGIGGGGGGDVDDINGTFVLDDGTFLDPTTLFLVDDGSF